MAARTRDAAAGRSPFPVALTRVAVFGLGFLVLVAALFAGVGVWQSDDASADAPPPPAVPVSPPPASLTPPPAEAEDDEADVEDDAVEEDGAAGEPPASAPAPAPAPSGPRPGDVTIQLLDAVLDDGGTSVTRARTTLRGAGFTVVASNRVAASRADNYARTTILYTPGFEAAGRAVAAALGATEVRAVTPENRLSSSVMVHVVVKG